MIRDSHTNGAKSATKPTTGALDAVSRGRYKAARTKRLRKRMAPFDALDEQVVAVIERLMPEEGEGLGTNIARAILQAQTLRKELLLGKLKAEEIERRLEDTDIRDEWEAVKRALGIA